MLRFVYYRSIHLVLILLKRTRPTYIQLCLLMHNWGTSFNEKAFTFCFYSSFSSSLFFFYTLFCDSFPPPFPFSFLSSAFPSSSSFLPLAFLLFLITVSSSPSFSSFHPIFIHFPLLLFLLLIRLSASSLSFLRPVSAVSSSSHPLIFLLPPSRLPPPYFSPLSCCSSSGHPSHFSSSLAPPPTLLPPS